MTVEQIHESLVNGQRRQMVEQIKEFGEYDFFSEYQAFLEYTYYNAETEYRYFIDATVSYFRITNR